MDIVKDKIFCILQKYLNEDLLDFDVQTRVSLIEDLQFDSLQIVEFLTEVERVFHISFEESEQMLEYVEDLEKLIKYVNECVHIKE